MMAKKTSSQHGPHWTSHQKPAPGDLRLVQAFLNTASDVRKPDFAGPQALNAWLELWELVPPGTSLSAADLERAVAVREALRALIQRPNPAALRKAADLLDQQIAGATIRIRLEEDGRVRLDPVPGGLDRALARLFGLVAAAQFDGSWDRLGVCTGEHCRAVFFDFSKNRCAKWCSSQCASTGSSLTYRRRNLERIRRTDRHEAWLRRRSPMV